MCTEVNIFLIKLYDIVDIRVFYNKRKVKGNLKKFVRESMLILEYFRVKGNFDRKEYVFDFSVCNSLVVIDVKGIFFLLG